MLKSLSQEIRDCYERAEACARKAEAAFTSEMREDYRRLEESWLALARSYEFAMRLSDFSNEARRKHDRWRGLPN